MSIEHFLHTFRKLPRIAAVAVIALCASSVLAGELVLVTALTEELNRLLKAGDGLHLGLITQNEEQIEIGVRDMILQIDRARGASHLAKPHERSHLVRILEAAREQFELTQSSYGDERRARLEEAFNQLANLVRIYRLDRTYGIFFCPKDKTTWVQRGHRAKNPFRPSGQREPCGIRVSR